MVLFQKIIDLCSNEEDTDTDIQPQHQHHNGSQASIHIGIVAEVIKIDGKQSRENNPPCSAEQGAGDLASHAVFSYRNQSIETGKNKNQNP